MGLLVGDAVGVPLEWPYNAKPLTKLELKPQLLWDMILRPLG